jgi:hypothetical protein
MSSNNFNVTVLTKRLFFRENFLDVAFNSVSVGYVFYFT